MGLDTKTARTNVRRLPDRGHYDLETIHAILDEGFLCHVGFVDDGQPFVIPTGYARRANEVLIHGSAASRMLRTLASGTSICLTVTLVDGLVLAKSAFHHSINYRSVVILGIALEITDPAEKMEALRIISDHIVAERWDEVRIPNDQELKATRVFRLPIEEASAKIRTGPPKDDAEDADRPVWTGVLPLSAVPNEPIPADDRWPVSASVKHYARPK